jgi:hypothetical protein
MEMRFKGRPRRWLPKPNDKHDCQQAGAATILAILRFFRRLTHNVACLFAAAAGSPESFRSNPQLDISRTVHTLLQDVGK